MPDVPRAQRPQRAVLISSVESIYNAMRTELLDGYADALFIRP